MKGEIDWPWMADLEKRIKDYLDFHKDDIKYVLTGMALGFDQIVAQICIDLEIPFKAYIPFEGQEDKWGEYEKLMYNESLDKAIEIKIKIYADRPAKTAYHIRNAGIVKDSDKIICLYDEKKAFASGTGSTVRKAKSKLGLNNVINFWKDERTINK